jgi:hypothetical protein
LIGLEYSLKQKKRLIEYINSQGQQTLPPQITPSVLQIPSDMGMTEADDASARGIVSYQEGSQVDNENICSVKNRMKELLDRLEAEINASATIGPE